MPPESRFDTFLRRADSALSSVEHLFAYIGGAFIFGLMLLGVSQIIGRKLLSTPMYGYIDVVELSMPAFAFLAISYTERLGGHVRMGLLIDRLTGRLRWIVELVMVAGALFLIAVLIRYGWDHMMRAYSFGDTTIDVRYPWWPSKLMVPLALSVLFFRLSLMALELMRLIVYPTLTPVGLPPTLSIQEQAKAET